MQLAEVESIKQKAGRLRAEDRNFGDTVRQVLESKLKSDRSIKQAVKNLNSGSLDRLTDSITQDNLDQFRSDCQKLLGLKNEDSGIIYRAVLGEVGQKPKQGRIREIMISMAKNMPNPPNPRDLIELREHGDGQRVAKDLIQMFGVEWCLDAQKILMADESPKTFLRQSEKLQTALLKEIMNTQFSNDDVTSLAINLDKFFDELKINDRCMDMFTNLGDIRGIENYAALSDKEISHEQRVGMAIIFNMVQAPLQSTLKEQDAQLSAQVGKLFKQFQVDELTGDERSFLQAAKRLGQQYYERLAVTQEQRPNIEEILTKAPEQAPTKFDPATREQALQAEQQVRQQAIAQGKTVRLASPESEPKASPPTAHPKTYSKFRKLVLRRKTGTIAMSPDELEQPKPPATINNSMEVAQVRQLSEQQKLQMKIEAIVDYIESAVDDIKNLEGKQKQSPERAELMCTQLARVMQKMDELDTSTPEGLTDSENLYQRLDVICKSASQLQSFADYDLQDIQDSVTGNLTNIRAELDNSSNTPKI